MSDKINRKPIPSRINELMALHKFMADANIKSGSRVRKRTIRQ